MTREALFRWATAPALAGESAPRAVAVFAHPDDESIALASRLSQYSQALFLVATDGAPRDGADARAQGFDTLEAYRDARQMELRRALAAGGIDEPRTEWLGFADQGAALGLEALTQRVLEHLLRELPEVVFTHPYEGGHPDHDACAFAVEHAVLAMELEQRPLVIEAASYHQGPEGIEVACFLPDPTTQTLNWPLNAEEQARRAAVLACFESQRETLRPFSRTVEAFRIAPGYRFSEPPHPGKLFYDHFGWGMTGQRFRDLAVAAETSLQQGHQEATTCL